MAPEQAAGSKDVGPAADVYALGAILYEVLTSRPPFRGLTSLDTLSQVLHDEPVPPSRLQPATPRDLETICLRCLEKEPAKRYAGAAALAEDLGRFLRDEPIVARPIGPTQRLWRWARRNRRVAVLASFLALVLVTGLPLLTGLWLLAEARRQAAEAARTDLQSERDRSDETARQARAAVKQSFTVATQDPEFQRDGMQEARKLLLDRALDYFRGFTAQRQDDPALGEDLADAHVRIGTILDERGDLAGALDQFQHACTRYEQLRERDPDNAGLQHRHAVALAHRAQVESSLGQRAKAKATYQQSFELRERLVRSDPDNHDYQHELARAWMGRARLHYQTGELADAVRAFERARELLGALKQAVPHNELIRAHLADTLVGLGHALRDLGKPGEALKVYQEAAGEREQLVERYPYPVYRDELARVYGSLALAQAQLGRMEDSLRSSEKALALREALVQGNPKIADYRAALALSYINLSADLINWKADDSVQADRAFDLRRKAVRLYQELVQSAPDAVPYRHALLIAHQALAWSYRRQKNDYARALEQLLAAQKLGDELIRQQVATPQHRLDVATCAAQLALLYMQQKEHVRALEVFSKANGLLEELLAANSLPSACKERLSTNLTNMTYCLQETGQFDEAFRACARCVALREELVRDYPQVPEYAKLLQNARTNLAVIESRLKRIR